MGQLNSKGNKFHLNLHLNLLDKEAQGPYPNCKLK